MTPRDQLSQEYQRYLALRDLAAQQWRHHARIAAHHAEQFAADTPYGGDLPALREAYDAALHSTKQAADRYQIWLNLQRRGPT